MATNSQLIPPHPIPTRICMCGCQNEFQPKRKDQVYLNKQHADFAYNNGKRKERNKNEVASIKQERLNNRLLDKYWRSQDGKRASVFLDTLLSEGFNASRYISVSKKSGITYFASYDYWWSLEKIGEIITVNIYAK